KQIPYYSPDIWGGLGCTINRVNNNFFDQFAYSGHYEREADIDSIAALGIKKLRYPVLWEKHQPAIDTLIDWTWTEKRLNKIRGHNIDVIAGLVHHGSGPSFTQLADRNFPNLLAAYAKQVAEKFPWIEYYTPINEPLTTARFSGLYGLWYPHQKNTKSFMQMLLNELKGTVLAMQEIRKINPNAKLVQTEDLGKTYSTKPLNYQAKFENERRWLTFDILCGRFDKNHKLWKYFTKFSIPREDFQFFLDNPCPPDIFGFNYYLTSERFLDHRTQLYPSHTQGGNNRHRYVDVEAVRVELDEETGIEVLLREAWQRYKKPIAITEVHLHCTREEQLRWFKQVWESANRLKAEGMDLRAVTSWAILGSFGWNKLLTSAGGDYEPGVFDLRSGTLRPTALAKFINEITSTNVSTHHLSHEKGWWQRSTRLIYQSSIAPVQMIKKNSAPVLIIGKNGTLGKAFARICEERCLNYHLLSRQDCDISSIQSIDNAIAQYKPWAIINAAGFVRVDDAENDFEACERDNTTGAHHLAISCNKAGVQLMTFSSDLVFDGEKSQPYIESDTVNPLNVYGKTKANAEALVHQAFPSSLIIRTSAFFSPWDEYNFVHYVRSQLSQYESITVANDLIISPTYVPHLVNASLDILIDEEKGIWHLANKGAVNWSDFAHEIAERFELDKAMINSVSAAEINYPAKRPSYSVLGSEKGHLLPSLENAIEEYFRKEKTENRKVA
ncbi:MAG: family 1 glycosylhydrolase, partial [Flavisolibacter sp.]